MDFSRLRAMALALMFSESIAGEEIPASYNNQADYLRLIAPLADDAALFIAANVLPLLRGLPLSSLEKQEAGELTLFRLPEDCIEIMHIGLLSPQGGIEDILPGERSGRYRLLPDGIMLPAGESGEGLYLEYRRYPAPLGPEPEDAAEIDLPPEAAACLPYYAAGQLLMYDDPYRSERLMEEYRRRLSLLRPGTRIEPGAVRDVYGFY